MTQILSGGGLIGYSRHNLKPECLEGVGQGVESNATPADQGWDGAESGKLE